ncbi:hypothetical protein SLH46_07730 [Draconibacterium sp. IB214405]|uniref:hypothetical protein n=1 Tax=Draconibacterium sp. IB214405 TaxID=3097352 RepID=UPI002A0EB358|nr:hypothetical protein [Draconibacterium sp. IB214405]MDX8339069.1 hypothetical protein [Draconibacterium sp. IB214405]
MPKISRSFIRALYALDTSTPPILWNQIKYEISLQRDEKELISILIRRTNKIISLLKSRNNVLLNKLIDLGKLSNNDASLEEMLIDFVCNHEFTNSELNELRPYIDKAQEIEISLSDHPRDSIDLSIMILMRDLLTVPKIKMYVELVVFFRHLDYLYTNISKIRTGTGFTPPSPPNGKYIKTIIDKLITVTTDKSENHGFKSEKGFIAFCTLLNDFFENKKPVIPSQVIEIQGGVKGKIAHSLKEIYSDCGMNKLRSNNEFFNVVRVLSVFKEHTNLHIYKSMTS